MTATIQAAGSATGTLRHPVKTPQKQASPRAIFRKHSSIDPVDQSRNGRVRYVSEQSTESIFSKGAVSLRSVNSDSSIGRTVQLPTSAGVITEQQAIRERVAREFVLERHMPTIEKACRLGHFIVSITSQTGHGGTSQGTQYS
jgi:hypothetical protein